MDRSQCMRRLQKFEEKHRGHLSKKDKKVMLLYRRAIINPQILTEAPNFIESWLAMSRRYDEDMDLFYELLPAISDQIFTHEESEDRALELANLIFENPEDERQEQWNTELSQLLEKIL